MNINRYHIICDVDGVGAENMTKDFVKKFLLELPPLIKMNILAGPFIVKGVPENPGITGIVIIDKSHIAVHTFTLVNKVMIDIFSCEPFDRGIVAKYLAEILNKPEGNLEVKTVSWV